MRRPQYAVNRSTSQFPAIIEIDVAAAIVPSTHTAFESSKPRKYGCHAW